MKKVLKIFKVINNVVKYSIIGILFLIRAIINCISAFITLIIAAIYALFGDVAAGERAAEEINEIKFV